MLLNSEQKAAITYKGGPLLIIAGAGTGKTTVITERIKHLILKEKAATDQILALTFTQKAAGEMEERVDIALPYGYTDLWVMTFHAFCDRLLRNEAAQIGLNPDYRLASEAESLKLLQDNLFSLPLNYFRPLGNPTRFLDGLWRHFSRLKDEDVNPEEYLFWAKNLKTEKEEKEKYQELAKVYQKYEEIKVKEGLMDFGDLIIQVLTLFRKRPNVLRQYRQKFAHILIDEFQDTNIAQYQLLKLLAPPKTNPDLTIVADDSQCLPKETKIALLKGEKRIDQIKPGEKILTAVGKGYTSLSKVRRVFKRKARVRLLTFELESGQKITVTDNHKMFCYLSSAEKDNRYYLYLMAQKKYGWCLGITRDLPTRLKIEPHADKIIGIGSYASEEEARYYEALYAAKYGLPTVPFNSRPHQASGAWRDKLFAAINTQEKAQKLANDLHLELDSPHCLADGVVRGKTERIKIHLEMCHRRYPSKYNREGFLPNPQALHLVRMETSSAKIIAKLKKAGFKLHPAKKGEKYQFRTADLKKAWEIALKLAELTGGVLDKKFAVGKVPSQTRAARIMPASHILVGNYLPVLQNKEIVYKKVIKREEKVVTKTVYDLEVEQTHNFIANGVVVHNSIYKFRGAAVSNILQFKKDYPQAKMVSLIKNYRSYQEILDASYRLIRNNDPDTLEARLKISKNLKSQRGEGGEVEFWHFNRFDEEAEAVAGKIKEMVKEGKYAYGDFAILLRTNRAAQNFIQSLRYQQIPYQFLGPGLLFHQPEIKDLIAYLSFLTNPNDNLPLYRLLRLPVFDLSGRDLAVLNGFAKNAGLSFFEALNIIANPAEKPANLPLPFLSLQGRKTLEKITRLLNRHLELTKKEKSAGQMLYYFLQDSGLLAKMGEVKTAEEERQVKNIARFFEKLRQYELDHEDSSPEAVLSWINLSLSLGESPLASEVDWGEENRVNLLTVHSAKGLEFPVVFLVNLAANRFPLPQRREQIPIPEALIKEILPQGNYHEQEERRLFYVGMTRAADCLFLTAADYYGEKRKSRISPFVFEALGEKNLTNKISSPLSLAEQLSIFKLEETTEKEEKEEKFILPPKISFSQLETFEHCPAQFYYAYLKRLPTPPTGNQNFGSTIHKTLLNFYQAVLNNQEVSLDLLLNLYEKNWLPFGFKSRAWEKRLKKEGEQMLRRFFKEGFSPTNKPLFLEKRFVFPLKNWRLSGVIDRVDKTSRGYEIIDYKTGKTMTDREIEKSLQMTVYALAATDPGILGAKPEEITATFYFLSEGVKKSIQKSAAELEKGRKELLKRLEALKNDRFLPKPGFWCDFCPYRALCDAW